jgi:hypothetical protein
MTRKTVPEGFAALSRFPALQRIHELQIWYDLIAVLALRRVRTKTNSAPRDKTFRQSPGNEDQQLFAHGHFSR